ncbi:MAG: J domain-containing protein [Halobacteriaceae archaeon]
MVSARLGAALAWVFAVIASLFGILGLIVSPVALGIAVPFGLAAYVLHRTARRRVRRQSERRTTAHRRHRRAREERDRRQRQPGTAMDELTRQEALSILELSPDADEAAIREAYRTQVMDVHPDQGGDEERFRRVQAAHDRLLEETARRRSSR